MSGRGIGRAAAVGPLEAPPGLAAVGWDLPSAAPAQGAKNPGLAGPFGESRLPVGRDPARSLEFPLSRRWPAIAEQVDLLRPIRSATRALHRLAPRQEVPDQDVPADQ